MYLELFHHHFEDVAKRETRFISLMADDPAGIPADDYALIEVYCTDPKCDCRRVLLNVLAKKQGHVATISYGFDPNGEMPGPFLDPFNRQSSYAEELMVLVKDLCLNDPAYVARLERHYRMIKDKFAQPSATQKQWKKKRRKRK